MTNETTHTAATVAEPGAHVAPEKPSSKKKATRQEGVPKGRKGAKGGKTKSPAKKDAKAGNKAARASAPRVESKGATILELIGRPKGATLVEIQKATAWQAHSVRGFLSTAARKCGLTIESAKNNGGERTYKIKK